MNNTKNYETSLIRSRTLAVLFSMLISALILLPLFSSAKGKEKAMKNTKLYMQPLNKEYHAAVTIASLAEGKYTLTVESENGDNLYYNQIMKSAENFSKIFDFSNLEEGEYTLKIKSKGETKVRHFNLIDGKIKVIYEDEKVEAKPEFKIVREKAYFHLPNSSEKYFTIRIVNSMGDELYSSREKNEMIKKVFDFSNVNDGDYQVLATSNQHNYTFNFNK